MMDIGTDIREQRQSREGPMAVGVQAGRLVDYPDRLPGRPQEFIFLQLAWEFVTVPR